MATFITAEREAERRAKTAGVPVDAVLPYVEQEIRQRPIRFEYTTNPNPTFMAATIMHSSSEPDLSQFRLDVNVGHPWVSLVMFGPDVTPEQRSMVEIVLLTLADVDKRTPEERRILDIEIHQWGTRLYHGGKVLEDILYPDGRPETPDE